MQGTLGCQYMAFNASSTRLAASCDALRLVVVFSVAPSSLGQRLATFAAHNRPILPIRFLPPLCSATPAAEAEAEAAALGPAAAAGALAAVLARDVLAMYAGTASAAAAAATSSSSLEQAEAALRDGLLAYCEVNGGVHIADLG
jgi:hypothetical protein